jgi:serine phosphatase RsbU (regulator of sigma subunit)
MKELVYLFDDSSDFKPQTSLLDAPFSFETAFLRVCIFYLSHDGSLGGDSFVIKSGDKLAISLLSDMTGHGAIGRNNISPHLSDLKEIVEAGYAQNDAELKRNLIQLDSKLNVEMPISLSFLRILRNGIIHYLNVGENMLLIKKYKTIIDKSEYPGGKMGFYSNLFGNNINLSDVFIPKEEMLNSGDRIIMFSDGVLEYLPEAECSKKSLLSLKKVFSTSKPLENCLKNVNSFAASNIHKANVKMNDDYTLIALELK